MIQSQKKMYLHRNRISYYHIHEHDELDVAQKLRKREMDEYPFVDA